MSTVAQWLRPVVRVLAEPVMQRMAEVIAVARERGASDEWVEQQLESCRKLLRDRLSETFNAKVTEMVVAEVMASYRSQVEPPSRAVQ